MNINNDNYELWLLRYAEQELTAEEQREVEQWLAEHPEAAEELALYNEAPRLERDESVRYVASPRRRVRPLWTAVVRWSAAAAVVLLLMVPAMRSTFIPEAVPMQVAECRPALEQPSEISSETSLPSETSKTRITSNPSPSRDTSPVLPEAPLLADDAPLFQDTLPVILVEQTPSAQYVDDLIAFEDEATVPLQEPPVTEVTYISNDNGLNPVGHFIGIFFKVYK